jgi:hypothetical protein
MRLTRFFLLSLFTLQCLYAEPTKEAIVDPETTYILQSNFAYFKRDKQNAKKGKLHLFNLSYTSYFFRANSPNKFGYISYANIIDLWLDKGMPFNLTPPSGILVYYLSSVDENERHARYNEIHLKFSDPYYDTITNSIEFKIETIGGAEIPLDKGELIDVTLFIN